MTDQIDPNIFFSDVPEGKSAFSGKKVDSKAEPIDPNIFYAKGAEPKPKDKYEEKVEGYMPEARDYYKDTHPVVAAAKEGLQKTPILGPVLNEVGADIEAALPKSVTGLKGETYKERREDFKAKSEALTRAGSEKSPVTAMAAEIAGSFAIPFGGIAGPVEGVVASKLPSLGPTAARAIGMAAEGSGVAGASALASKYLGTQPASESPDVGTEAAIGGAFGAALPVAGKVIKKVMPDWVTGIGGKDRFMNTYLKSVADDVAAGEDVLGIKGALEAVDRGQPVSPFNIGGTRTQQLLLNTFKGRGDALTNFTNELAQRIEGAGDRFDNTLREMAGIHDEFNLDALAQRAKEHASTINEGNYQKAAWLPDNGVGLWNNRWDNALRDKYAQQAVQKVNEVMSDIKMAPFQSPIDRAGHKSIDALNLSDSANAALKSANVNSLFDLAGVKNDNLRKILHPDYETAARDSLVTHLSEGNPSITGSMNIKNMVDNMSPEHVERMLKSNNLKVEIPESVRRDIADIRQKLAGQDLNKLTLARPENMNVEYLDRLQRELYNRAEMLKRESPGQNMVFTNRLRDFQNDIIGSMKGPQLPNGAANPYYNPDTYNAAFEQAHNQSGRFFKYGDAFTMGRAMLRQLNSGLNVSKIMNAVKRMDDPQERNMFVQGILGEMKNKAVQGGALKYNTVDKWFGNSYVTNALEDALGPQKFGKLKAFVRAEAIMHESLKKGAQLEGAGRGANILGIINQDAVSLGVAYLLDSHLPILGFAYSHVINPYFGVKHAARVRSMLESGDLNKMSDAYDQIMKNPRARNAFLDGLNNIVSSNVGAGNVGIDRFQRATGGRTSYNDEDSVLKDAPSIEMPSSLQELQAIKKRRPASASVDDVFTRKVAGIEGAEPISMPANLGELESYKRTKRATGGRIPHIDKAFKVAKRELDGETKPMLNMHDDDIVRALRIAQGRV